MPDLKTVTFDAELMRRAFNIAMNADWHEESPTTFVMRSVWETAWRAAMLAAAPTPAAQSAGQEAVFTLRKRGDDFDVTNITPGYSALPEGEYALYAAPVNGGERECGNADCGWVGPTSETVHPKHDRSTLLCPRCHETTESNAADAQQVGGDEPTHQQINAAKGVFDHWFHVESKQEPEEVSDDEARHLCARMLRAALSADGGDRKDAERYRLIREMPTIVMHYGLLEGGAGLDSRCDDAKAAKAKGE